MPTIDVKLRVTYFGGTIPCPNAKVTIYDVDKGGNGDDVIFTDTTDSNGYVQGKSKNWKDTNTIKIPNPFGSPFIQPVPDVLVTMVRIRVDGQDTGRLPIVLPLALPIILPFGPPTPSLKVNGKNCSDGYDLQKKARAAFEADTPKVTITIRGPDAAIFQPLTGNISQLKSLAKQTLPGVDKMLYQNPTGAGEILAIAVVILAIGAATSVNILATAVAFSLVLALVLGYCHIKCKTVPGNSNNPLPGIEFEVSNAGC